MENLDPETLLTRQQVAEALTKAGFPVKAKTLSTKVTRGGGPPFRKFGPRPLYVWGEALAWAKAQLGPVVTSSSQLDRASQGGPHAPAD
jgi:hypothetical protein